MAEQRTNTVQQNNNFGWFFDNNYQYTDDLNIMSGKQMKKKALSEIKAGEKIKPNLSVSMQEAVDGDNERLNDIAKKLDPNKAYTDEMLNTMPDDVKPLSYRGLKGNVQAIAPKDKKLKALLDGKLTNDHKTKPTFGHNKTTDIKTNFFGAKVPPYYMDNFNHQTTIALFKDDNMIASRGLAGKYKYDNGYTMNVPGGDVVYNPSKLSRKDYDHVLNFYNNEDSTLEWFKGDYADKPVPTLAELVHHGVGVYDRSADGKLTPEEHSADIARPTNAIDQDMTESERIKKNPSIADAYKADSSTYFSMDDVRQIAKDAPVKSLDKPNAEFGRSIGTEIDDTPDNPTPKLLGITNHEYSHLNRWNPYTYSVSVDKNTGKPVSVNSMLDRTNKYFKVADQYTDVLDKEKGLQNNKDFTLDKKMKGLLPKTKSLINRQDYRDLQDFKKNIKSDLANRKRLSSGNSYISERGGTQLPENKFLDRHPNLKTRLNVKTDKLGNVYTKNDHGMSGKIPFTINSLSQHVDQVSKHVHHSIDREDLIHKVRGVDKINHFAHNAENKRDMGNSMGKINKFAHNAEAKDELGNNVDKLNNFAHKAENKQEFGNKVQKVDHLAHQAEFNKELGHRANKLVNSYKKGQSTDSPKKNKSQSKSSGLKIKGLDEFEKRLKSDGQRSGNIKSQLKNHRKKSTQHRRQGSNHVYKKMQSHAKSRAKGNSQSHGTGRSWGE